MILFRRRAALAACIVACAWAALIVGSPWLAAWPGPRSGLAASAYLVGSLVCHQQAGRSFHLAGAQLPVCARCTALYLGGACGLAFGLILPAVGVRDPLAAFAARQGWRAVLGLAAAPMLLTVALEWAGAWGPANAWRAALSLPAAWAAGALVAESLSFRVRL